MSAYNKRRLPKVSFLLSEDDIGPLVLKGRKDTSHVVFDLKLVFSDEKNKKLVEIVGDLDTKKMKFWCLTSGIDGIKKFIAGDGEVITVFKSKKYSIDTVNVFEKKEDSNYYGFLIFKPL